MAKGFSETTTLLLGRLQRGIATNLSFLEDLIIKGEEFCEVDVNSTKVDSDKYGRHYETRVFIHKDFRNRKQISYRRVNTKKEMIQLHYRTVNSYKDKYLKQAKF